MLHVILVGLEEEKTIKIQMKILDRPHSAWEQTNLEVITDEIYYREYFAEERQADLLVIDEYLFTDTVKFYFKGEVLLLSEAVRPDRKIGEHCTVICKNGTLDYLMQKLKELTDSSPSDTIQPECKALQEEGTVHQDEGTVHPDEKVDDLLGQDNTPSRTTKLLTVSSSSGGVGKTTVSLGLARALSGAGKKVLYLNVSESNTFQWRMCSQAAVSANIREILNSAIPYWDMIRTMIAEQTFQYLLPFPLPLYMLNLDCTIYEKILYAAINSKEYDLIIADMGNVEKKLERRFINSADHVLLVSRQDKGSVYAMRSMAERLEISNDRKFFTLCNFYRADQNNSYQTGEFKVPFVLDAYVSYNEKITSCTLEELGDSSDIQRLAMSMNL